MKKINKSQKMPQALNFINPMQAKRSLGIIEHSSIPESTKRSIGTTERSSIIISAKRILVIIIMALCVGSITAQEPCDDYMVGNGTSATNSIPLCTARYYSYSQQIFDAGEIGFNGVEGTIKSVSFQYINPVTQYRKDVKVYLANTTKSTFTSTTDWIPLSQLQLVYSGGLLLSDTNYDYWVTIPFSSTFTYTGGNVAVVVLDSEGNCYTNTYATFYLHNTSDCKSINCRNDDAPINPANPPTAAPMVTNRNNVKFEICKESPCYYHTVGNGTMTTNGIPIATALNYSYTQQIFDADELGFTGAEGTIRSVAFQYFYSVTQDRKDVKVYLANTTKSTFASKTDWIPLSQLQLVYSGSLHLDNTGYDYWVTIPFSSTFTYTGGNVAVVVLDSEGNSYTGTISTFYMHEVSVHKALNYFTDDAPIDPANPPTAVGLRKTRNNVKFEICPQDTEPPSIANKTVTIGTVTSKTIPISFQAATDNMGSENLQYRVFVNMDPEWEWWHEWAVIQTGGTGTINYTIEYQHQGGDWPLTPNTTYYISVWVVDEAGNYNEYNHVSATTSTGVGVDEWRMESGEWRIYPNPASDKLRMENGEWRIGGVEIYGINGRMVKCIDNPSSEIDVSDLQRGIYFVKIKTEKGEVVRKLKIER